MSQRGSSLYGQSKVSQRSSYLYRRGKVSQRGSSICKRTEMSERGSYLYRRAEVSQKGSFLYKEADVSLEEPVSKSLFIKMSGKAVSKSICLYSRVGKVPLYTNELIWDEPKSVSFLRAELSFSLYLCICKLYLHGQAELIEFFYTNTKRSNTLSVDRELLVSLHKHDLKCDFQVVHRKNV